MTREDFARLVQERGGLAGQPVIVDPQIDNPDKKKPSDPDKIPNPNPRRTYIFNNGTQLEARGSGDETDAEGRPLEIQITDAGTALKPSAGTSLEEGVSAPKDQRYIVSRKPDGTLTWVENQNYTGEKDAKSETQVFGNDLLRINPDGSTTVIATKPAAGKEPTTVAFGDTIYSFDGTQLTPLITKPKEPTKPTTEVRNGKTYQWDPATNSWSEAAGLPAETKPSSIYGTGPNDRWRITLDDQGNVVSKVPNDNYVEPKPTQLTPDTVSANIPLLKPDGTIEFQPNQNQVMVSQAMSDLLNQVGVQVSAGQLSMADAKDMLTGAVNAMNAQTAQAQAAATREGTERAAAGDILSTQAQGATTAAGMLNQRAQTAQNLVQQGLGAVTGSAGRYGQYSGGILSPMAGFGQNLVQGAQGFATELGGGQAVYDTAVRMVQAADPNNQNPDRASAVALLRQLMDKYHQATGQEIPAVTATRAASASQQTGGMVAPQPQPAMPQGFNQYGSVMGTPGVGMPGNVSLAPAAPQAPSAPFVAPPLAVNNLTNLDPRLRGAIY